MSYALEGPKWASPINITWSFANLNIVPEFAADAMFFTRPIAVAQYMAVVTAAFAKWSSVANISFLQVKEALAPLSYVNAADIRIGFTDLGTQGTGVIGLTQYKSDENAFYQDTLIGVEDPNLAYIDQNGLYLGYGSSLYQVVLHEIGHAIGMGHSVGDVHSVMNPIATANDRDLDATDIAGIQAIYGAPIGASYVVGDATDGVTFQAKGEAYSGGVAWLKSQYIIPSDIATITTDNLNILTTAPSCFMQPGSGNDAIDVSNAGGNNVIDGGAGNNYLKGGSGNDVFFADDRKSAATWDTLVNFHANDQLTLWGINRATSLVVTADDLGAVGAKGLTILASTNGGASWAAATLAGYTQADLSNGKLTLADGFDKGNACSYLWIQAH